MKLLPVTHFEELEAGVRLCGFIVFLDLLKDFLVALLRTLQDALAPDLDPSLEAGYRPHQTLPFLFLFCTLKAELCRSTLT